MTVARILGLIVSEARALCMVVARAPARAARVLPFVLAAIVALVIPVPAGANHAQSTPAGRSIVFDHLGGNEWWVEAQLGGADGASVTKLQVAEYPATTWKDMTFHDDWGNKWAASPHVTPGNPVKFRATWSDGSTFSSCWFSHPAGVESCGGTGTPFDATFTGVRGNEWWVQANVATNGPSISKVEVRVFANNAWGAFMPVAKQSWGWGSSYHILQGNLVQLRATASDGQTDLSSCRQWIPPSNTDATIVACPGGGGGGTAPFDATFSGVKANEWWVQVNVAANEPLAAVSFRTNCSPYWNPLTKQSWGGWAPTYQVHFNDGDKVDFMATSADGDVDASGGYVMRAATATAGCALGAWPREGSRVVYDLSSGVCGGGECESADATLTLTYRAAARNWEGFCVGQTTRTLQDGSQTHEAFTSRNDILPLFGKVPTAVGATQHVRYVGVFYSAKSCGVSGNDYEYVVDHQETRPSALVDANHDPISLQAWVADRDVSGANYEVIAFDTKLGMVFEQDSYPRMSGQGGGNLYLTDTDAPIR